MNYLEVVVICKALGDNNRLQIIEMLKENEICACKILEEFKITQPTLSHHMKVLSECNLVNVRKDGKWCYYSLNESVFNELNKYFENLIKK